MARVPRPGAVKTRLVGRLGPQGACDLYRAFVQDLDERLSVLEVPVLWCQWPEDATFAALVPHAARTIVQRGNDLGERMHAAFVDALSDGFTPTVMVGADVPHLPLDRLGEAMARLQSGVELVLGPARDGGYYLIGLRCPAPALFRDMPWGTPAVYELTMQRASDSRMATATLAPWFDIDESEDLDALVEVLNAAESAMLPRTRAALVRAGIVGRRG